MWQWRLIFRRVERDLDHRDDVTSIRVKVRRNSYKERWTLKKIKTNYYGEEDPNLYQWEGMAVKKVGEHTTNDEVRKADSFSESNMNKNCSYIPDLGMWIHRFRRLQDF
jgi:hypothetical protein